MPHRAVVRAPHQRRESERLRREELQQQRGLRVEAGRQAVPDVEAVEGSEEGLEVGEEEREGQEGVEGQEGGGAVQEGWGRRWLGGFGEGVVLWGRGEGFGDGGAEDEGFFVREVVRQAAEDVAYAVDVEAAREGVGCGR